MSKLAGALRNPTPYVAILMGVAMLIGATLWFTGPTQSNKFTELGMSLFVTASVGLGLMAVERLVSRRAEERKEAAAEEARFIASLLGTPNLSGVRLRGRVLSGVVMADRMLDGADLSAATLDRVDFRRASLAQATFEGAKASDACFAEANLRGAVGLHFFAADSSFDRTNCNESDWSYGRLRGCSMNEARMIRAVINSSDFSSCQLKRTDFSRAEGADVNFSHADLRAASFSSAHLMRPDYSFADMRGADLTNAFIEEPNLIGADLRDCRIAGLTMRNPQTDAKTRMPESMTLTTFGAI